MKKCVFGNKLSNNLYTNNVKSSYRENNQIKRIVYKMSLLGRVGSETEIVGVCLTNISQISPENNLFVRGSNKIMRPTLFFANHDTVFLLLWLLLGGK